MDNLLKHRINLNPRLLSIQNPAKRGGAEPACGRPSAPGPAGHGQALSLPMAGPKARSLRPEAANSRGARALHFGALRAPKFRAAPFGRVLYA